MRAKRNSREKRNGKKHLKKIILIFITIIGVLCVGGIIFSFNLLKENKKISGNNTLKNEENKNETNNKANLEDEKTVKKEIVITAAGDCTLGTDTNFDKSTDLVTAVANTGNDYSALMKNMESIFSKDDYTIVNLENAFTEETIKADKGTGRVFHFKGPKEYAKILKEGNIEGVTIANNHIYDYGIKGFEDTIKTLKENEVEFCGEGYKIITEIQGIKFAFLGYQGWSNTDKLKQIIKNDIDSVKKMGAKVVIPYFHWGIERENKPTQDQVNIARYCIDNGAEMVLGSHPHVIQSLENYRGKMIVYSLGNFSFGGNSNPVDKRTFIIQMKYIFENEILVDTQYKVVPALISSVEYKNDYIPTPATGEDKVNILKYMNELSPTLNSQIQDEFWSIK